MSFLRCLVLLLLPAHLQALPPQVLARHLVTPQHEEMQWASPAKHMQRHTMFQQQPCSRRHIL
jgi:hypothetical protein